VPRLLATLSMCSLIFACGADGDATAHDALQSEAPVRAALADAATPVANGSARNPFAGARFYVDPDAPPAQTAKAWRATRAADAAQLDKIANTAQADWVGGWTTPAWIAERTAKIDAAGALPVYVFYNIPGRDCGQHSSGGAGTTSAYDAWIAEMVRGLGGKPAVVILEPDAIALTDCLSAAQRDERFGMLKRAVAVLAKNNVAVYLDAGHGNWHAPAEMATRLTSAGVAEARGFSLNVSNFGSTASEAAYGREVSARIANKPFVIDTSRNGLGSNGEWCNPSGRALGARPTASTGFAEVDAFLWIKRPGESDGACNGGPNAGVWWPEYALGLAQRAAY
jgi:endoglucanase